MEYVIRLTDHVFGGDCLGRLPDGRVVFVPFGIEGELVRIRLVEEKRGFSRAILLEVIDPSPQRAEPRCCHFGQCGGCQYQHITYSKQLDIKTSILKEQLDRVGVLKDTLVLPCIASPEPYQYRNHVQFHQLADGQLGYYKAGQHELFSIVECYLPECALGEIWPLLKFEGQNDFERISLRRGIGEDIQIILEGQDPSPPELLVEELPVSVVYRYQDSSTVLVGSNFITQEINDKLFQISSGSFFQVNSYIAARITAHLLSSITINTGSLVIDGYCGVGLFSKFIAPFAGRVVGIESSSDACDDFSVNLDEFDNVELYQAPAEKVLPSINFKPDVIILDPPRTGIGRKAMEGFLRLSAATIAYISCDPATLARDARELSEGGYSLRDVTPFDMFPQTSHIESVSIWDKI